MSQTLYNKAKNDQWEESEVCMAVIARFGTGGNNIPIILDALPFDTTQVTSDKNWSHPKWGDPCHPLAATAHTPAVVVRYSETDDECSNT